MQQVRLRRSLVNSLTALQEVKGIAKQVEGTAQKKAGDLKEAIHDAAKK